jgi:hypothetical protein
MRRVRKEATKVWHNPEIVRQVQRDKSGFPSGRSRLDERQQTQASRAALEALFAPRQTGAQPANAELRPGQLKAPARIVGVPPPSSDLRTMERERLLSKVLVAEGRPSVSKAVNEYLNAGFELPEEQDVHLQLLEHADEAMVRTALSTLGSLLSSEAPKRRAVLESRLRRIEQFAEEGPTQKQAEQLRRSIAGRPPADHRSAQ